MFSLNRSILLLLLTVSVWAVLAAGDVCGQTGGSATVQPPDAYAAGLQPATVPAPAMDQATITTKSLLQVIRDGGPLMIPISISSFILLVFVFERFVSLRRGRVIPRPFVKRFLQQLGDGELDAESALELCEKNRSPVSDVFAAAVRKWSRPSVEIEQAMLDTGERVASKLRKYLRVLSGVSTVCPLLGLLGTVLGMIRAFNAIATADAMGRPELLAAGIGQALLTTAAGLSVAIPALIVHLFFIGRVDQLVMDIDSLGQRVVDLMTGDAPRSRVLSVTESKSGRRRKDSADSGSRRKAA